MRDVNTNSKNSNGSSSSQFSSRATSADQSHTIAAGMIAVLTDKGMNYLELYGHRIINTNLVVDQQQLYTFKGTLAGWLCSIANLTGKGNILTDPYIGPQKYQNPWVNSRDQVVGTN